MSALEALVWPLERLSEALVELARAAGLEPRAARVGAPPSGAAHHDTSRWIELAAEQLGIEAEPLECPFREVSELLRHGAPLVVGSPGPSGLCGVFALLGGGRRSVILLGPDLRRRRVRAEELRAALLAPIEAAHLPRIDALLDEAKVPAKRRQAARRALLEERLGPVRVAAMWSLRPRPGAPMLHQLRHAGLLHTLGGALLVHALLTALWVGAWWILGRAALSGTLDRGWLLAWALALLTTLPLRLLWTRAQHLFAFGAGALLKRRLLAGALRLPPEEVRRSGAGQHLGRVIEAEAVETLALGGGLMGLTALLELVAAAAILAGGAGGLFHALALAAWSALALLLGLGYLRRRGRWTSARLSLTHGLVERMVGHRTRLAQQAPERWHEGEDEELRSYVELGRRMDRALARLSALAPRGWLVLGSAALAPAFIGGETGAPALAVSIGGTLFGMMALRRLVGSLAQLSGAVIAARQIAPLYRAAAEEPPATALALALTETTGAAASGRLLEAGGLTFRHQGRLEPILRGCSLSIIRGDRLLLEGPSGGGKSTFASILAGLRVPDGGVLLAGGLDLSTLGPAGWQRRVGSAPQFHENHVFSSTFQFNLLLGTGWPPTPEAVEEATELCQELGLGPLLERMPGGLLQMVGETGWQLSHGERSRLYLARALLRDPELVVLDESFAALDPENLERAMRCVLARARTVLVIAHP